MRKQQAELSFDDSSYKVSRTIEQLSAETLEIEPTRIPGPRGGSALKLQCLECSRKFTSRNSLPECPGCGGSDIDLA